MTDAAPAPMPNDAPNAAAAPGPRIYPLRSGIGIASIVVTGLGLVLVGLMVLVSLIPDMAAILWLLIVVIPIVMLAAAVGLVLGIIGIVLAVRRPQSPVLPSIGIVLAIATIIVGAGLLLGWFV